MSNMHADRWALIMAALVVPATLQAQAERDSSVNNTPAVETGNLKPAAVDTGLATVTTDTSETKPEHKNTKAKRPQEDADTAANRSYNPY